MRRSGAAARWRRGALILPPPAPPAPPAGIVAFLGSVEAPTHIYLVQELCEGGDLFDALASRGAYSEADARDALAPVFRAVTYMHARGVVHRDLKPENLLLTAPGDDGAQAVKVCDFGLAAAGVAGATLTLPCGTWAYGAPEVRAKPPTGYGAAVDAWSLGVITYVALCGYHPFDPEGTATQGAILLAVDKGVVDVDGAAWAAVSDEAKSFVRELLTRDPAARLTVAGAAEHAWLRGSGAGALSDTIADDLARYRKLMRQKLKASMLLAVASVRLFSGSPTGKGRRATLSGAICSAAGAAADGAAPEAAPVAVRPPVLARHVSALARADSFGGEAAPLGEVAPPGAHVLADAEGVGADTEVAVVAAVAPDASPPDGAMCAAVREDAPLCAPVVALLGMPPLGDAEAEGAAAVAPAASSSGASVLADAGDAESSRAEMAAPAASPLGTLADAEGSSADVLAAAPLGASALADAEGSLVEETAGAAADCARGGPSLGEHAPAADGPSLGEPEPAATGSAESARADDKVALDGVPADAPASAAAGSAESARAAGQ